MKTSWKFLALAAALGFTLGTRSLANAPKINEGSSAAGWNSGQLPTPAVIPSQIYGLAGEPCRVRFDALVYAPISGSVLFDVEGGPGGQNNDALVWHPHEKRPGGAFQIGIYSGVDFKKLEELSSEFIYCNPLAVKQSGSLRWLAIGDSLTAPGFYVGQTVGKLGQILPQITLVSVGTANPPENSKYAALHHEGRGGWTWARYLTAFNHAAGSKGSAASPFVFGPKGADDFDFTRYVRENLAGKAPDIITIFLGINDIFGASPGITQEKIDDIMKTAQSMVNKIRLAAPETIIGLIPPPASSDQRAFAVNYQNGVTEWQYRRALQLYRAALLQTFDGRRDEGIYIVPGYLAFDAATAFPSPPNALHPKEEGFIPISLELSAWMTHLLETQTVIAK